MKALRYSFLALCALFAATITGNAAPLETDQLSRADVAKAKLTFHKPPPLSSQRQGQAHARHGLPIDSLLNWNDHYFADGFDPNGNPNQHWYTNTVGNPPWHGGTTLINVSIVPVIVDLRNEDGSPRFVNGQPLVSSPEAFVQPVLNSPVFAFSNWSSSSVPTQLIDAEQRAAYFSKAKDDWHTLLVPAVKPTRRMVLNKGSYFFALNDDGSCCLAIFVDAQAAFNTIFSTIPNDGMTILGAAQAAGDITTKDITVLLLNNTVLFNFGGSGFVPGFHTWDFQPNDKFYVIAFVSWTPSGVFGPPVDWIQDITALSHELAEIINDPFIGIIDRHNITPWWLSPIGFCTDFLEVGDPLDFAANNTYPITMNGMTYHPESVVLAPWFKRESPSSALHNAYTYPNETLITSLSPLLRANCQ